MPRVRAPGGGLSTPTRQVSIPLNDDKQEKAQRLQSRHDRHAEQMGKIKASVISPGRKRKSVGISSNSPGAKSGEVFRDVIGDTSTPIKRVPILANFEEWMKMATDNKINANNSWNFALIDYFHDMSLLKEGDGVNFQKASCTLDGCVKIYTSRIDSMVTETGRLLSGLTESNSRKKAGGEGDAEGEEEDEGEGPEDDGTKKKTKKKAQRSAEATLVSSFDQIALKKVELEFNVDPLFKKASADFDEGGAKGLLLNHLCIDRTGRIVFDSSDDVAEQALDGERRDSMDPNEKEQKETKAEPAEEGTKKEEDFIDIAALGARFFPNLAELDNLDICPSLKTYELGGDEGTLNLPFLKAPENWRDTQDTRKTPGLDDDGDYGAGGDFDTMGDVGFGQGGEAWARHAALEPQMLMPGGPRDTVEDGEDREVGAFDIDATTFGIALQPETEQDTIFKYFDETMQKNWAGPEHWKISRVKAAKKPAAPRVRKEKEPFAIDFLAPMSEELRMALYTPAASNAAISLPKSQWRSPNRHLLPDDTHFNSKDLLRLFLKPKAKLGSRIGKAAAELPAEGQVDVAFWAAQSANHNLKTDESQAAHGDYDADFFNDDNLPAGADHMDDDDDEFADAREMFSPEIDDTSIPTGPDGVGIDGLVGSTTQLDASGRPLIMHNRRAKPDYVQYARVAKKVDIRRLKEEMWYGIGFEKPEVIQRESQGQPRRPHAPALAADDRSTLNFTSMMKNLHHAYPKQQLADISTSYGFICLLHLANEKGLVIENVEGFEELRVRKDFTAPVTVEA